MVKQKKKKIILVIYTKEIICFVNLLLIYRNEAFGLWRHPFGGRGVGRGHSKEVWIEVCSEFFKFILQTA